MSDKVKVYSKNVGFSGIRLVGTDEVVFKDGVASCTEKQAKALIEKGGYFNSKPAEEKPEGPKTVNDADTQKLIDDATAEADKIKTDAQAAADQLTYEKAREIIVASEQAKDKRFLKDLAADIKAYVPPQES